MKNIDKTNIDHKLMQLKTRPKQKFILRSKHQVMLQYNLEMKANSKISVHLEM